MDPKYFLSLADDLYQSVSQHLDWMDRRDFLRDRQQGNKDSHIVVTYPPLRFSESTHDLSWLSTPSQSPATLYIHIPFCTGICSYCSYLTKGATEGDPEIESYLDSLIDEIRLYDRAMGKISVETCYIGGGTPTILTVQQIERLLTAVNSVFSITHEYTLEGSPETITEEKIRAAQQHGVNRVSIGVESWNDDLLQNIRRRHDSHRARLAIEQIRAGGIDDIDIDLIRGLPGSSIESACRDVSMTLDLDCSSMTNYQYAVKPRSIDHKTIQRIDQTVPDQKNVTRQHLGIIAAMTQNGYRHQPVDWFYKHDHVYHHNILKWRHNANQIALGIGSYGYWQGRQYNNTKNIKEYKQYIEQGRLPIDRVKTLDLDEQARRHFILGLKTGLDLKEISDRYGLDATQTAWWTIMEELIQNNVFSRSGTQITPCLTAELCMDRIQERFYREDYNAA